LVGQRLLLLNGYEAVSLPKAKDLLDLAEGVIVKASPPKELKQYIMFVQPTPDDYNTDNKNTTTTTGSNNNTNNQLQQQQHQQQQKDKPEHRDYPVFVEEDIRIYHVLESHATIVLDNAYNTIQRLFELYVDAPFKRLADRILSSDIIITTRFPDRTGERGKVDKDNDDTVDEDKVAPITRLNPPSSKIYGSRDPEPFENILVMSPENDEMTIYTHFHPSTRIVALPYVLTHNSASTLVHVSLVVFGALPLAYRSYNFARDYPGWSQTIAASVVFTISYGVWSSRTSARTNQSRVVTNALLHRVFARDDAVVLVLQEGAVRQLTRAVLNAYYDRWLTSGLRETKICNDRPIPPALPCFSSKSILVDPVKLSAKLGLLVLDEDKHDNNKVMAKKNNWKANTLDDALSLYFAVEPLR
jgi:hypothetical protein